MLDPEKENLQRRCPRLGSMIPYKYCMISGEDSLPCFKILDCWWETFDVESYLKENVPAEIFDQLALARPREKVASLVDIAEKAKDRLQD